MTARVDLGTTEADFIEFTFEDEKATEAAERCFPTDFVHSGGTTLQYRAEPGCVEAIRERLQAAGLTWREEESGLTDEEMWPEWPGDTPGP